MKALNSIKTLGLSLTLVAACFPAAAHDGDNDFGFIPNTPNNGGIEVIQVNQWLSPGQDIELAYQLGRSGRQCGNELIALDVNASAAGGFRMGGSQLTLFVNHQLEGTSMVNGGRNGESSVGFRLLRSPRLCTQLQSLELQNSGHNPVYITQITAVIRDNFVRPQPPVRPHPPVRPEPPRGPRVITVTGNGSGGTERGNVAGARQKAEERALFDVAQNCSRQGGYLLSSHLSGGISCQKERGSRDDYICRAQAVGQCQIR